MRAEYPPQEHAVGTRYFSATAMGGSVCTGDRRPGSWGFPASGALAGASLPNPPVTCRLANGTKRRELQEAMLVSTRGLPAIKICIDEVLRVWRERFRRHLPVGSSHEWLRYNSLDGCHNHGSDCTTPA